MDKKGGEQQLRRLERLRPKYRIHFASDQGSQKWPAEHKDTFEEIQKLGDVKFDSYPVDTSNNVILEPWKFEVKSLATQLVERAGRCVRRNEASWRSYCEHVVFARLSAEVACRECRKRIWRSEVEPSTKEDSGRARALKKRRLNREPCRCPRGVTRRQDPDEVIGLNPIFTHREEERIFHDSSLQKDIIQAQKPDSVYGLRQTRNFEETLHDSVKDGPRKGEAMVYELLKTSPLKNEGDPLLFPFLILEAKAAKAANDWDSIKLQTAFPIRTLLDVQLGLRAATGSKSKWEAGPLVWFFMNRGEDWRLCAAFVKEGNAINGLHGSIDYHIIDLWAGSISSKNGALELLLIVDYICDWARDVYRDAILTELRILSAGTDDIVSVLPDSDIFSSREFGFPGGIGQAEDSIEGRDPTFNAFTALDSPKGVVRHAAFFESRFCCLFITNDNAQTLLQSTNENAVQQLSRLVLAQLSGHCETLDLETLDALEELWTGNSRYSRPFNLTQTKFFTTIVYANYMSLSWQQVRELYVLAVAVDAFDFIVEASGLCRGKGKARKPLERARGRGAVKAQICRLQSVSMHNNLLAAIQRISLRIYSESVVEDDGATRGIVHCVYHSFKKGRLEPSESFLRVSNRHEHQKEVTNEDVPWRLPSEPLQVSTSGAVLIHGDSHPHDGGRSKQSDICLYFAEGTPQAPSKESLGAALKDTFENNDVYHTTRNNGRPNIKTINSRFNKTPWNLDGTYGIYLEGREFLQWCFHLDLDLLTRQGSPRECESGSYILSRNPFPWKDPRNIGLVSEFRKYLMYKIFVNDIKYWRSIAQDRVDKGIECCSGCAEKGYFYSRFCDDCHDEIVILRYPQWVADALVGKDPVHFTSTADHVRPNPWRRDNFADFQEWYKELSEYADLDVESNTLVELYLRAVDYQEYRMNIKYPGRAAYLAKEERKRKRLLGDEEDRSSVDSSASEVIMDSAAE